MTTRTYRLVLAPGGPARARREGPPAPLGRLAGRPAHDLPRLAALFHPVCPRAHGAAAAHAVEAAAGIVLAPGQAAAREAAVLAEALGAAAWRAGFDLPALMDAPPDADAVRDARSASDDLVAALFAAAPVAVGGAVLRLDRAAVANARARLRDAADRAAATSRAAAAHGARIALRPYAAPPPLADAIDVDVDGWNAEESPRTLYGFSGDGTLAPWFLGQAAHAEALARALDAALGNLADAPAASLPADAEGAGGGVALTARGRLRHRIVLEKGALAGWRADAPTDWNFAPNGPAARAAAALPPGDDLAARARALVAAFDPCAPCAVQMAPAASAFEVGEAAHA